MRALWSRWLESGAGLAEREPEELAANIAGTDLTAFFQNALYSTNELPLESALQYLGADLKWQDGTPEPNANGGKSDGKSVEKPVEKVSKPRLSATLSVAAGRVSVMNVLNGGAAELAGLAPGDIIIAIDNIMISDSDVSNLLQRYASENTVVLHYSRHGALIETQLPILAGDESDTCTINRIESTPVLWPVVATT